MALVGDTAADIADIEAAMRKVMLSAASHIASAAKRGDQQPAHIEVLAGIC